LVDDDELILEGLRNMLAPHHDRVEVVGRAPLTDDLPAAVAELGAEIALVEVTPGGTNALEIAGQLAEAEAPSRVVVFTYEESETRVFDALRLGAAGYILKSLGGNELVELLLRARGGEVVVDPTMATRIAMRAAEHAGRESWPGSQLGLSRRESDVVALLVNGLDNRAIAAELEVGEETVKTHLRNIYRKLDVKDRAHAVATVLRAGIFS
jgi:DNA-binding NarL/FixJ family response regulator